MRRSNGVAVAGPAGRTERGPSPTFGLNPTSNPTSNPNPNLNMNLNLNLQSADRSLSSIAQAPMTSISLTGANDQIGSVAKGALSRQSQQKQQQQQPQSHMQTLSSSSSLLNALLESNDSKSVIVDAATARSQQSALTLALAPALALTQQQKRSRGAALTVPSILKRSLGSDHGGEIDGDFKKKKKKCLSWIDVNAGCLLCEVLVVDRSENEYLDTSLVAATNARDNDPLSPVPEISSRVSTKSDARWIRQDMLQSFMGTDEFDEDE